MPGPLVFSLAAIPWPMLLEQAPALWAAANALLQRSRRKPSDATAATDVQALRERIAELEQHQQDFADLVKRLADQGNALAAASQASAIRARRSLIVATVAV